MEKPPSFSLHPSVCSDYLEQVLLTQAEVLEALCSLLGLAPVIQGCEELTASPLVSPTASAHRLERWIHLGPSPLAFDFRHLETIVTQCHLHEALENELWSYPLYRTLIENSDWNTESTSRSSRVRKAFQWDPLLEWTQQEQELWLRAFEATSAVQRNQRPSPVSLLPLIQSPIRSNWLRFRSRLLEKKGHTRFNLIFKKD
jgi:hypothetical protein